MAGVPLTERPAIGRLRLRQAGSDVAGPIAARARAERLVGRLELRPPGLPAGAVLIIRELRLSLPPGVRAAPPGATGDALGPSRAALRERLARLAREAARPAHGPVPPRAASVVFLDRAELLACLTRDVLAGGVGRCWWWQRLALVAASPAAVIAGAWQAEPRAVPAALAALAPRERVAAVTLLGPGDARGALAALHEAHGLPRAVAQSAARAATPPGEHPSDEPPWRAWLPAPSGAPLGPEHEALLGTALALAAAPHLARSAAFAARAAAWRRARDGRTLPAQRPPTTALSASTASASAMLAAPTPGAAPGTSPAAPGATRDPARAMPIRTRPPDAASPHLAQAQGRAGGGGGTISTPAALSFPRATEPDGTSPWPASPAPAPAAGQARALAFGPARPFPEGGAHTDWGGVLYLVNLLDWLGPPSGWAANGALDALGGWAAVELLARGLLARAGLDPAGDPLFDALAALDGRTPEQPLGLGLRPGRTFHLPSTWLARERRAERTWAARRRGPRLRLWDTAQRYLVAELPLAGGDGTRQAARVAARCAARVAAHGVPARIGSAADLPRLRLPPLPCPPGVAAPIWGWLRRALGGIESLLRALLGPELADRPPADALRARGRVMLSRTHVDLVLPPDAAQLPLRRAGLDRDPGWRPDLGRIVLFHFE